MDARCSSCDFTDGTPRNVLRQSLACQSHLRVVRIEYKVHICQYCCDVSASVRATPRMSAALLLPSGALFAYASTVLLCWIYFTSGLWGVVVGTVLSGLTSSVVCEWWYRGRRPRAFSFAYLFLGSFLFYVVLAASIGSPTLRFHPAHAWPDAPVLVLSENGVFCPRAWADIRGERDPLSVSVDEGGQLNIMFVSRAALAGALPITTECTPSLLFPWVKGVLWGVAHFHQATREKIDSTPHDYPYDEHCLYGQMFLYVCMFLLFTGLATQVPRDMDGEA